MLMKTTGTSKLNKLAKPLALILAITLCFCAPFSAYAAKVTKSIYTPLSYTHNSRFDNCQIENAIDISQHNGTVDFAKIKKTDTKIIIVRVGCRGYGSKGTLLKDASFDTNISGALKNGFITGVYFYSQALSEAEAIEEANFVLQYIKNYEFQLPVYFDYEFATSSGRLDTAWRNKTLNKEKMTKNALAFCQTIEDAGYRAGVYACKSFLEDNLDCKQFEGSYPVWLAHYTTKTNYAGAYQMWQYSGGDVGDESNRGKVSGIDGYVDTNFVYYDVFTPLLSKKTFEVADIPNQTLSGGEVKPALSVKYEGKELIKGEDYYVTFENNKSVGPAKVIVTGINDYQGFARASKTFNIIPPKMTGFKVTSEGDDSVSISWDKGASDIRYYIQIYKDNAWVKAGVTQNASFTIENLDAATTYKIRARAYKYVNSVAYVSAYTAPVSATTNIAIPTSLSVSAVKPTSLKLSWSKQSGISFYQVYMYNPDKGIYEYFRTVDNPETNYLTVKNLTPNSAYRFKVTAHKVISETETVSSKRSSGILTYTAPNAPTISTAKSNAYKKISVTFRKVSGVTGYQVMWSTTSNFSSNYKSVYVTGNTTLTTAQSGKYYYVRVRAYKTRNGVKTYSPWSKTLSVKTK